MLVDKSDRPKARLRLDVATATVRGACDYQEDTVISGFSTGNLTGYAIVADGVGGHAAGDIASGIVATEIFAQLKIRESQIGAGMLTYPRRCAKPLRRPISG